MTSRYYPTIRSLLSDFLRERRFMYAGCASISLIYGGMSRCRYDTNSVSFVTMTNFSKVNASCAEKYIDRKYQRKSTYQ